MDNQGEVRELGGPPHGCFLASLLALPALPGNPSNYPYLEAEIIRQLLDRWNAQKLAVRKEQPRAFPVPNLHTAVIFSSRLTMPPAPLKFL